VNKSKTLEYGHSGVKSLLAFDPIASASLDSLTTAQVTSFISKRRKSKLKVSSMNRELEGRRRSTVKSLIAVLKVWEETS
jgi:hypothetical protein